MLNTEKFQPGTNLPWCNLALEYNKADINFGKMISREELNRARSRDAGREPVVDKEAVDKGMRMVERRVIAPDFNRFKGRYRLGQQLPAFMENLNSRMAITGLSFEMLRANRSIDDLAFSPTSSGSTIAEAETTSHNKSKKTSKMPKRMMLCSSKMSTPRSIAEI